MSAFLSGDSAGYESIGEFLSEHPFFGRLTVEVHPQGSMAIGTTKPEGKAQFDVDLVARLAVHQGRSSNAAVLRHVSLDLPVGLVPSGYRRSVLPDLSIYCQVRL